MERLNFIELKDREYHENCTIEEVEAIKNRVSLINEDIIHVHALKRPTVFSSKIITTQIGKYVKGDKKKHVLINVNYTQKPNQKIRTIIKNSYLKLKPHLVHITVYTNNDYFAMHIVKFIALFSGVKPLSIFSTKEKALTHIKSLQIA